ncbi:hypothetical protein RYH80_11565 [Halobaculum sp. MBLA0147]|uniref:hypothetical protein n=1 Tax=Halobaculum sp. MBLA0147 TaxID=3079934 RepID=UPI0035263716
MKDTTRPRLRLGSHLVPGLAAVALFAVLAVVVLGSDFGAASGFPTDVSITASIGYAMFNLEQGAVDSEGFLVAFMLVALVLDTALDGAVMLAKREGEGDGGTLTALTDGGRDERTDGGVDVPADESTDARGVSDATTDTEETGGDH